jgi:SRSO17 transposase
MPDLARMRRCKEVTALELSYVAGILPNTSVWPPGMGPLPPKKWSANGRPTKLMRRDDKDRPCSVKELALGLPKQAWRNVKWRESSADFLTARFARLRVRPAHRDYWLSERHAEEWLLIEWPDDESEPTKYWFLKTSPSAPWSVWSSSDGASNATTKSLSRRSASGIMKGAFGAASITTPRYASPPTVS